MYNPRYLTLSRHNIYYLCFPIPPAFHPKGRNSQVRCSLGTRDPKEALHMARRLVYCGDTLISNPAMVYMDYQEIHDLLIKHFREEREQVKKRINKQGPLPPATIANLNTQQELADQALKDGDYSLMGTDEDIAAIIEQYELPIEAGTADEETLRIDYLKLRRDALRGLIALNKRYDGYDFSTRQLAPQFIQPVKEKQKAARLDKMIDSYAKEKVRSEDWSEKSASGYRQQLGLLLDYFGDNASLHISVEQANEVKNMLMNLPKHRNRKKELEGLSLKEVVALSVTHPAKLDNLMKPINIKKHLTTYKGFYDWAVTHGHTNKNNFKGINLKVKKKKLERHAFTSEQMKIIYKAVLKAEKVERKWGVLIACFTGARVNEIAQMYVEDIKQEEGIWYFDINEEGQKRLKNYNSNRTIPIHSKLIELGFLDYVKECKKAGHTRVLHQLPYAKGKGYGRNVNRWFNEQLLPRLELKTPALTFHSLRHVVATKLQRANVEDSLIKRIMGHAQDDVLNRHYTEEQLMKQKQDAIEKLWPL